MTVVILCKGLPGSGKTTWAEEYVRSHPQSVLVCRDDIRERIFAAPGRENYQPEFEELVRGIRDFSIAHAVRCKVKTVVVADTNLYRRTVGRLLRLIDSLQAEGLVVDVQWQDFTHVPLEVCIERDARREHPVGEDRIRAMHDQWMAEQTQAEGE